MKSYPKAGRKLSLHLPRNPGATNHWRRIGRLSDQWSAWRQFTPQFGEHLAIEESLRPRRAVE